MLERDSIVIVHLVHPTEKLWGVLTSLDPAGVQFRGLPLDSFDDWMREVAGGEKSTLGLSTLFAPMHRVERIYLDETVGAVESFRDRFERQVGLSVEAYLGLGRERPEIPS